MLGVLSVFAGLAVGYWVVKRLFGRQDREQPADVATFDFYVEADDVAEPVKAQHVQ